LSEWEVTIEGKSETEAVEAALNQLGLRKDQVELEIIKNKGLLSLGKSKSITVKARLKETALARANRIASQIAKLAKLEIEVQVEETEQGLLVKLSGPDSALAIGRHGLTLIALQTILGIAINKELPDYKRVIVDVDGYRERRKKSLESLAEKTVGRVLARNEPVVLQPMNSYERMIVHSVVSQYQGVSSSSSGEEPNRQVTISPEES
jgi:spoIIIJ-associated protein